MFTEAQAQAYLDRIGFTGTPALDKKTLDQLVLCHQESVPFETIDVHRGACTPSVDEDALFDKLVTRNRGGYCFELNKAFELLLRSLGFDARPVLSRAVRGRPGRMPINHRGILVSLDDRDFSVDVGFGGPMPAGALCLEDGRDQVIHGEDYGARLLSGGWWAVERTTRANHDAFDDAVAPRRQVELELCTATVEEQDFDALNLFFSQPGTLFRDHLVVNLRTPHGSLALLDNVLTVREDGRKEVIQLEGRPEIDEALARYFGLHTK